MIEAYTLAHEPNMVSMVTMVWKLRVFSVVSLLQSSHCTQSFVTHQLTNRELAVATTQHGIANHTVGDLEQAARSLTTKWGLGTAYQFAEMAGKECLTCKTK